MKSTNRKHEIYSRVAADLKSGLTRHALVFTAKDYFCITKAAAIAGQSIEKFVVLSALEKACNVLPKMGGDKSRSPANPLLDVINVEIRSDYTLYLEFENGEKRLFDMSPYLDKGVFLQLKDVAVFEQGYVDLGTMCWPGNIDIAPETLYDQSRPA